MKFCKDCLWFRGDGAGGCAAPENTLGPNLVTGEPEPISQFCEHLRNDEWRGVPACGKEAVWFQPKRDQADAA